ncbi:hypothetical protein QN400_05355 [Pseudomonas sp. RTC3]|uniref:hypothetical protein n=1 Tax=unclassified Pseudomonas TaxID=196821 RepID=UPI002AB35841|nr:MULTISPECIES: hypothetical protein [unclassified Pseudomonas]MEB0061451.1 hypothetical protein [Pseudomonas sp. RTC3]MDY7566775.1 hypothetical protein [Pseudomonas sp. 5C2]MEB0008133.1 hypothetical protein [Pseudomonas sp. RTB2]MEB0017574.1 hypothetical protein [Pseudomonas sp. RTB3]MEB0025120.1 hypothetical protein [Pseudomonas sp. MH9.2]
MRWLFLLLLMLNAFYYIWHQQEAPLRAKEVISLSLYRGSQQDIHLLSESDAARENPSAPHEAEEKCLYLGGFVRQEDARLVEQRLTSLDIQSQFQSPAAGSTAGYWLRVAPSSRRLVDEGLIQELTQDFSQLKNKIMSCEGIATTD